jgi:voltage-gated potassium channel
MERSLERTNFFYLLAVLLIFLIAVPLNDNFVIGNPPIVRAVLFSLILIVGVRSLKGGGRFLIAGMIFVVAGVILSIVSTQIQSVVFQYGSLLSLIGFILIAIVYTFRQVAFGTDITTNRLVGAICVYLLLGVIWALSYSMLELAVPGSFAGFDAWSDRGWDSEWLYFSFVTMTTMGYGDILPISATARALAYLQAVFGQFYVAILVAGLVSAYISRRQRPGNNQE